MSLSGMTGFARTEGAAGAWTWAVEARSVNGRNLEARFRGPPGFDGLERSTREAAQARFTRGQIAVGLQAKRAEAGPRLQINIDHLESLIAASTPLVTAGKVAAPTFDGLLRVPGVMQEASDADDAETRRAVEAAMACSIEAALDGLHTARLAEGASLAPVLDSLVNRIEALVATADCEAAAQPEVLKTRFARRIADLLSDSFDMEARILQEAAALAVRADVREELDRLTAHVAAARTLLMEAAAAGRRLDFLAQEFMREANTLCSKSALSSLTAVGLDLKATIEQLREQIQNVE